MSRGIKIVSMEYLMIIYNFDRIISVININQNNKIHSQRGFKWCPTNNHKEN